MKKKPPPPPTPARPCPQIISNDPINKISFAAGGTDRHYNLVTYVAKDRRSNRCACPGLVTSPRAAACPPRSAPHVAPPSPDPFTPASARRLSRV